jgi:hypothetical protein
MCLLEHLFNLELIKYCIFGDYLNTKVFFLMQLSAFAQKVIKKMIRIIRNLKIAIHTRPFFILFCLWILIQLVSFLQFGIVTNNEAVKYRNEAYNIVNTGHFLNQNIFSILPTFLSASYLLKAVLRPLAFSLFNYCLICWQCFVFSKLQ